MYKLPPLSNDRPHGVDILLLVAATPSSTEPFKYLLDPATVVIILDKEELF